MFYRSVLRKIKPILMPIFSWLRYHMTSATFAEKLTYSYFCRYTCKKETSNCLHNLWRWVWVSTLRSETILCTIWSNPEFWSVPTTLNKLAVHCRMQWIFLDSKPKVNILRKHSKRKDQKFRKDHFSSGTGCKWVPEWVKESQIQTWVNRGR